MKKKKKHPISEDQDFKDACVVVLAMYNTCTSDTKRCFVGGQLSIGNSCLVFFKGDVDDVFAVQEFLEKRK